MLASPTDRVSALSLVAALLTVTACNGDPRPQSPDLWTPPKAGQKLHSVTIARPPSAGKVRTEIREISGARAGISCATCHGGTDPLAKREGAKSSGHENIELQHADLRCESCHAKDAPARLHTSSGDAFPLADSMRLCSQCHGPIRKAYDHGAHGGMRGYWDLQRGPRVRNDCITCHSPHHPAYPKVTPAPGPRERHPIYRPEHAGSVVDMRFGDEAHE